MLTLNGYTLSEKSLLDACDEVYENGYTEEQEKDFQIGYTHNRIVNFDNEFFAGHWEDWVEEVIEQTTLKIEVLCDNLVQEYEERRKADRYIEASQLLVQVYTWEYAKDSRTRVADDSKSVYVAHNIRYKQGLGYEVSDNPIL
ncbi:MAG: hypothetical protein ICV83_00645 [Cytophagales bacterium]|nr:hypothetical protein [Cytophagales bacterium]